ncbi:MAG: hypothetical protein ACK4SY_08775 [Pyrobaculum sp.]
MSNNPAQSYTEMMAAYRRYIRQPVEMSKNYSEMMAAYQRREKIEAEKNIKKRDETPKNVAAYRMLKGDKDMEDGEREEKKKKRGDFQVLRIGVVPWGVRYEGKVYTFRGIADTKYVDLPDGRRVYAISSGINNWRIEVVDPRELGYRVQFIGDKEVHYVEPGMAVQIEGGSPSYLIYDGKKELVKKVGDIYFKELPDGRVVQIRKSGARRWVVKIDRQRALE